LTPDIRVQIEHKVVMGSSRSLDDPSMMYATHQQEMFNQQLV